MLLSKTLMFILPQLPKMGLKTNLSVMKKDNATFPREWALAIRNRGVNGGEYAQKLLWQLYEHVTLDQTTRGRLRAALGKHSWGARIDEVLIDDFAAFLFDTWATKRKEETILDDWDGEDLLPESMLRKSYFFLRAMSFRDSLMRRSDKAQEFAETKSREGELEDDVVRSSFGLLEDKKQFKFLHAVKLNFSHQRGMTRPTQMAGIQLYPHMDWNWQGHKDLKGKLLEVVLGADAWAALNLSLSESHTAAQGLLGDREFTVWNRHLASNKKKVLERDLRVLKELDFKRRYLPLVNDVAALLLSCSTDNAYQITSRYRHKLVDFLQNQLEQLSPRERELVVAKFKELDQAESEEDDL